MQTARKIWEEISAICVISNASHRQLVVAHLRVLGLNEDLPNYTVWESKYFDFSKITIDLTGKMFLEANYFLIFPLRATATNKGSTFEQRTQRENLSWTKHIWKSPQIWSTNFTCGTFVKHRKSNCRKSRWVVVTQKFSQKIFQFMLTSDCPHAQILRI